MPMKGSYNFLAVDERFAPWLFLIRSSSEDLLQKIPELIEKAKRIGEQAGVSRQRLDQLIVVFDREGYSAELYRYLDGKDQGVRFCWRMINWKNCRRKSALTRHTPEKNC